MLAEKQDQTGDGQHREQEVRAKISGTVHVSLGIVTRGARLRKRATIETTASIRRPARERPTIKDYGILLSLCGCRRRGQARLHLAGHMRHDSHEPFDEH
jgi:hypothetical protein